jgi:predicted ester cyclase
VRDLLAPEEDEYLGWLNLAQGGHSEHHVGMSVHHVRHIYLAVIAAVSAGDDSALDELMAENLIDHNPAPGQPPGRAGFKYWAASARDAFPDLTGVVEDTIVEGNKVAARVTWRGTHRGVFAGVAGTGVAVEFAAFHIAVPATTPRRRGGRGAPRPGFIGRCGMSGGCSRLSTGSHPPSVERMFECV